MRIAVIGAGGMGGYYGGLLAQRNHEVTFIARGAHLRAIQQNGLQVRSVFGDFRIRPARSTDRPEEVGSVDLVLFCTKTYDTDEAALLSLPMIGRETSILSLQNGVDAAERIGKIAGMEHMLAGTTWISSATDAPGTIKQVSDFRRVAIGELSGKITPRVRAVRDAFSDTGVTIEVSENIRGVLWSKFIFIAAASGFGSLTRLPLADYRAVPEARVLIVRLMRETEAVGRRLGARLSPDAVEKALTFMDNVGPNIKASMQLDVEAGRRTELESIIGYISRKGRELDIPTLVADMLYGALLPVDLMAQSRSTWRPSAAFEHGADSLPNQIA
jgi:2-dehydropantoate 2-reductase